MGVNDFSDELAVTPLGINPEVIEQLVVWQVNYYSANFPDLNRADWESFYKDALHVSGTDLPCVLVGHESGQLMGTIALTATDDLTDVGHYTPWVAALLVNPAMRGEGRGLRLLNELIEMARQRGEKHLYL